MPLRCLVPFCNKTRRGNDADEEWICPAHFLRIDRETRRSYDAAHARATAADKAPGPCDAPHKIAAYKEVSDLWERCRTQALDRLHLAH
jgi:hypothetical protein